MHLTYLPPAFAACLAAVHLFSHRLLFLDVIPRSRWLSMSGGVSVAYVFVHLLPEIQRAGEAIEQSESVLVTLERHVYLIALVGFVTFYGLERYVRSRKGGRATAGEEEPDDVFWIHVLSFAAYNALVGYLLFHREETGVVALSAFFVAMALHFFVNDWGLREHHGRAYDRYGRWLLSGAVFVGLVLGYATEVDELFVGVLLSFLGGGVILNVIKEELPAERQSRFWAFAAGVTGYTLVLMAV